MKGGKWGLGFAHLRIKNGGIRFHDRDRLVKRGERVRCALIIRHHDREVQFEFLRVQLGRESVLHALLLPSRDLHVVARCREVADDLRGWRGGREVGNGPQGTPNEDDGDGGGFVVADGEDGEGGVVVDEFYAEDLGGGEGGGDVDGEVGRLRGFFGSLGWRVSG